MKYSIYYSQLGGGNQQQLDSAIDLNYIFFNESKATTNPMILFGNTKSILRIPPEVTVMNDSNIIDLTNIVPEIKLIEEPNGLQIMTDAKSKNLFSPMFENPLNAKETSPSDSIHLVIPGLMPVLPEKWKDFDKNKIFYMPNDIKPHLHGSASHHMGDGFKLDRAFSLNKNEFIQTDKKLTNLRGNLDSFNNGEANTPIETWIHWKIPSDEKQYKNLKVKKHSIIWWDFNDHHNLFLVNSNKATSDDINISDNLNESMNIVVTIMDKIGTYYFICTVPGHAELGHKIQIEVIE